MDYEQLSMLTGVGLQAWRTAGVTLVVVGTPDAWPVQATAENVDVTWATTDVGPAMPVQMDDGSRWIMQLVQPDEDQNVIVSLRPEDNAEAIVQYIVPQDQLDVRIWVTGNAHPGPIIEIPATNPPEPAPPAGW